MALNDLIRNGLKIADAITKPLQPLVTVKRWIAGTSYGDDSYGPEVQFRAIVDMRLRDRVTVNGQLMTTRAEILFLDPVPPDGAPGRTEPIDTRDVIILPDGTTGPIVEASGFIDSDTNQPYFGHVWLGVSSRNAQ